MLVLPVIINIPLRFTVFLCLVVILFHSTSLTMMMPGLSSNEDPCDTCNKISEKFLEAYKKTAGSNFGGGNTDWEERKLKGYAKSETRLIEIMEQACSKTDSQCSSFLEKYEDAIEEWYQNSSPDSLGNLNQWLCIDTAKVCCPEGTFGKNCRRCQYGDNGLICSGNGYCNGNGKRTGNGRCDCYTKYKGTNCSTCESGYIKSIDENKQVTCTDIDECRTGFFLSPCLLYKCNNTEGSYECYGEPFYRQLPKISTLAVLFLTASIFLYKELYAFAAFTLMTISVLIIVYAKNLL